MNSQQLLGAMCAAMLDDCWLERVQDEIDALPEAGLLPWEREEELAEYVDWQLDVEWMREGC